MSIKFYHEYIGIRKVYTEFGSILISRYPGGSCPILLLGRDTWNADIWDTDFWDIWTTDFWFWDIWNTDFWFSVMG